MRLGIEEVDIRIAPAELSKRARIILEKLVNEEYGISPLPTIHKGKYGKPYFPEFPDIHFSISHCKSAVMAVIDSAPVGCDIEDIQEDAPEEFIAISFSESEIHEIRISENPLLTLTAIWTRKEAFVKREGEIPDDPRDWDSGTSGIHTCLPQDSKRYVYSIALSEQ